VTTLVFRESANVEALYAFNPDRLASLFDNDSNAIDGVLLVASRSLSRAIDRIVAPEETSLDARENAHQLKGAAGNVGADELSDLAEALELELLRGWTSSARAVVASLPGAMQRFTNALSAVDQRLST
jgi:HPt (histidine-containing phosphotransfer) domain-containing protein